MVNRKEKILLSHGSGGRLMHQLVQDLFLKNFNNPILKELTDAAVFRIGSHKLCFSTDSFVVKPIFFPGGDIGSLSVYGTVNDLAVMGARPLYLSLGLIISEGLSKITLAKITQSIAYAAKKAAVKVITGDTKVIEYSPANEIFINTTGIGIIEDNCQFSLKKVLPGDQIILSGTVGDHGIAVLAARGKFDFKTKIKSDAAALNWLTSRLLKYSSQIKFMRDVTRGGLATVLNEIIEHRNFGIVVEEEKIPIKKAVRGACELLGLDPLYIGNEGKLVLVVKAAFAGRILSLMRKHKLAKDAQIIGRVTENYKGKVVLQTSAGGLRIIDMLMGEPIPRIC